MEGRSYRLRTQVALLLAAALAAAPAGAATFPAHPLSAAELAGLRGGLEVAGLRMDLTARMRTYIDQRLASATEMQITRLAEGKATMTRRLVEAGLQSPAADNGTAPSVTTSSTGDVATTRIDAPASTANNGIPPSTSAASAATAANPVPAGRTTAGQTRVDHVISPRQVVSTITNTADNRSVHHAVELELRVHNFTSFAARARDVIRARALGRALAQ